VWVRLPPPALATETDTTRQDTSKPSTIKGLRDEPRPSNPTCAPASSRQVPPRSVSNRPLRAITGATVEWQAADTKPWAHDPHLTQVIDAWPDLPEAVRAGIMAMVKATSGNGGGR
jgi:hypothetical protein